MSASILLVLALKVAHLPVSPEQVWARSSAAIRVSMCESHRSPTAISPGGAYRGRWQFDSRTWLSNGGGRYSQDPARATAYQQDQIAYRTWKRRGWEPWTCARIVGVL